MTRTFDVHLSEEQDVKLIRHFQGKITSEQENRYYVSYSFRKWYYCEYSAIPLLRPPKIKTFYPLKTLFAKFKLFSYSFSTPSVSLNRDHRWDRPKVVLKTTFGQSQRWSYYRDFTVYAFRCGNGDKYL